MTVLSIHTNMMAAGATRHLANHYSGLSASVRRLASGLRVGTAADDAAGLAIRELMRADITALNQGVRNANDAISLIQTADGALQVIDEKLIRMKELAEQAATGTYNSTQRLMIDSEYQQMAREISRIANATDFNGISLLNGDLEGGYHSGAELASTGKLKVHFGSGNDSAEDYYYIQIEKMTAEALSIGDKATPEVAKEEFKRKYLLNLEETLKPIVDTDGRLLFEEILAQQYGDAVFEVSRVIDVFTDHAINGFPTDPLFFGAFVRTFGDDVVPRDSAFTGPEGFTYQYLDGMDGTKGAAGFDNEDLAAMHAAYQDLDGDEKEKWQYAFLRRSVEEMRSYLADGSIFSIGGDYQINVHGDPELRAGIVKAGLMTADWFQQRHTYAGNNIRSQENAQHALEAIDDTIIIKDNTRAMLGATQNRLENTVSTLRIQAENLQAAESRISDVDVAEEMTAFVRNQILTQSAVAMLAQANSMPNMLMQLLG